MEIKVLHNILVVNDRADVAKLLGAGAPAVHKTRSGTPIGSPRYMSPEQCRGVEVDHRTDVYAFGCMAYRMLTGVDVFDGSTALELMMAHVSALPPRPSSRCPEQQRSRLRQDSSPQVSSLL